MQLKVPVLARDIPGNSAVIEDGENGLLFATPQVNDLLTLLAAVPFIALVNKMSNPQTKGTKQQRPEFLACE